MSRSRKLQERLKRSPANVPFEELRALLDSNGFVSQTVRGSHWTFRHPELREILTVPRRNPVKPVYVKLALGLIDKLEGK